MQRYISSNTLGVVFRNTLTSGCSVIQTRSYCSGSNNKDNISYHEVDRKYSKEMLVRFQQRLRDIKDEVTAEKNKIKGDLFHLNNINFTAHQNTPYQEIQESIALQRAKNYRLNQIESKIELDEEVESSVNNKKEGQDTEDDVELMNKVKEGNSGEIQGEQVQQLKDGKLEGAPLDYNTTRVIDTVEEFNKLSKEEQDRAIEFSTNSLAGFDAEELDNIITEMEWAEEDAEEMEDGQVEEGGVKEGGDDAMSEFFGSHLKSMEGGRGRSPIPVSIIKQIATRTWFNQWVVGKNGEADLSQQLTREEWFNQVDLGEDDQEDQDTLLNGETNAPIFTITQLEHALGKVKVLYLERMRALGKVVTNTIVDDDFFYQPLKYSNATLENTPILKSDKQKDAHYIEEGDTFDYDMHNSMEMTPEEYEQFKMIRPESENKDVIFERQFSNWIRERFLYKHKVLNDIEVAPTLQQLEDDSVLKSVSRIGLKYQENPDNTDFDEIEGLTEAEMANAILDADGKVIPPHLVTARDQYKYLLRKYQGAASVAKLNRERDIRHREMEKKKREIEQALADTTTAREAALEEERRIKLEMLDAELGYNRNIQKYKVDERLERLRFEKQKRRVELKSSTEYLDRQMHRLQQQGAMTRVVKSPTTGKEVVGNPKFPKCMLCYDYGWRVEPINVPLLSVFLNNDGDILPRYITGNCLKHQKKLARNIKAAKHLGLYSYKNGTFTIYDPNVVPMTPKEQADYDKYYRGNYTRKEWMDGRTNIEFIDDDEEAHLYEDTSEEEEQLHKEAVMLQLGLSEDEATAILEGKYEKVDTESIIEREIQEEEQQEAASAMKKGF